MKPSLLQLLTVALVLALGLGAGCSRGARSDAQIADDVHAKIVADANVQNKDIAVQSNNGLVTLSGAVGSETERGAVASDAAQVEGVKTVVNNLSVAPGRSASAAHGALARRAAEPAPAAAPAAALAIPAGTQISIRMIDSIDSEKNKPGDTFRASLDAPLVVGEKVVVAQGADVEGRVVAAKSAGHFTGRSDIGLELTRLTVHGRSYELRTNQFTREGASRGTRTAETVGGGAALGAIIGGVAGHGKGAAIGAAAGAGAGTAVQAMTKGQQIRIPSETVLEFRLTAPVGGSASAAPR